MHSFANSLTAGLGLTFLAIVLVVFACLPVLLIRKWSIVLTVQSVAAQLVNAITQLLQLCHPVASFSILCSKHE